MEEILRKHGIRATKTRLDILNLLKDSDPLTADEIYEKLQSKGAKLSSIYRNLSILTDENILIKIVGIDSFSYFQLNTDTHKHHLICKECKKTIPLDNCPMENLEKEIEEQTNFLITNHIFEFIGICPDCQKNME
ncbi:MAG: Fur family transcriptional regulator [Tissierellia bacterium]|nr:Fur family transcriptional regulator [Tissierellia bacterium]